MIRRWKSWARRVLAARIQGRWTRLINYEGLVCLVVLLCGCSSIPREARTHSRHAARIAEGIRTILPEGWSVEHEEGSGYVRVKYDMPVRGVRLNHPKAVSIVLDLAGPREDKSVFEFGFRVTERVDPALYALEKKSLESECSLLSAKIGGIPHANTKAPLAERPFHCRNAKERRDVARYRGVWRRLCDLPELYTADCGLKFFPSFLSPSGQEDRDHLERYYRRVMSLFSVYEGCEQPRAKEVRQDTSSVSRTTGAFFLTHKASGRTEGPFNYEQGGHVTIHTESYEIQMDRSADQSIKDRMKGIILPDVVFHRAHFGDVVDFLLRQLGEDEGLRSQFEGIPMSLYRHRSLMEPVTVMGSSSGKANDPFAGVSARATDATNGTPLTITFSARNISLYDALVTLCGLAGMEFRVSDGVAKILPKGPDTEASSLKTRDPGR